MSNITVTNKNKALQTSIANYEKDNQIVINMSVDDKLDYAKQLIGSGLLPSTYTHPQQLLVVMDMANSLKISVTDALYNIDFIGGSKPGAPKVPSIRAKMLTALIQSRGGLLQTVKDWEPVYGIIYDNEGNVVKTGKQNKEEEYMITDYITTIRGSRMYYGKLMSEEASFTWSQAVKRSLAGKPVWQTMPENMAWARALSDLARRFFSDFISGLYEQSEMQDSFDLEVTDVDDIR